MYQSMNFISGLPRAGTSLLAAILRQNPRTHASFASPIGYAFASLQQGMGGQNEGHTMISDEQRAWMFEGLFTGFYGRMSHDYVFDNNRRWCAFLPVLQRVFPASKIVVCLRPIPHVVDSIERLVRKNPMEVSALYGFDPNLTVYDRVRLLMQPGGLVGYALNAVRDAYYGPHRDRLVLVEYSELASHPRAVIKRLEEELHLVPFDYDFGAIEQLPGAGAFDAHLGLPGLHTLKAKVEYKPDNSILPPDIYGSLPAPFWRDNVLRKAQHMPRRVPTTV